MLNRLWLFFFTVSAMAIVWQLFQGQYQVLANVTEAMFKSAELAATICLGLVGILSFWMGMMRIGEKGGMTAAIAKITEPLLGKLMPEVPKGHPAFGSVTMNLTANFLGLDNAATPLGLKAMEDLQSLNPTKHIATNAQILFLVLNTSSITLVPVSVFLYRAQQGAANPTDIFLPILLATTCSTLVGVLTVAIIQRLPLLTGMALMYAGLLFASGGAVVAYLLTLSADALGTASSILGNGVLVGLIFAFVLVGAWRKVAIYDEFVEGAKLGFNQAVALIPYLLAMLLAIALLRASGVLELFLQGLTVVVSGLGMDTRFIDAMPTAIMKPLSGSGARAMMLETMQQYGVDSFAGRLAAIIQGSTETTFYVLAVYFGAVGIRNGRHALSCGLIADAAGITAAIIVCYWFYG
ncbi:MAG: nucleoside recognition domain-containing protein [Shewanella sp.]